MKHYITNRRFRSHELITKRIYLLKFADTYQMPHKLQQLYLMNEFKCNPYPSAEKIEQLSFELSCRPKDIRHWFQNQRKGIKQTFNLIYS